MPLRYLLLALLFALTGAAAATAQDAGVIRVRVLAASPPNSGQLVATGGSMQVRADGQTIVTVPSGDGVGIRLSRGRVELDYPGGHIDADLVEVVPSRGGTIQLRAGNARREYDGAVRVDADHTPGMCIIAVVPIESYVGAVVAGEYPFPEIEGVKAQAVLARTYALQRVGEHDTYDVVDSVMDQVYPGVSGATARTRRAAEETSGEVLAYDGRIAEVYYGSSNGGYTADNDEIWDREPIPYLRARPDPYDRASPDNRWTSRIPVERLHAALGRHFGGTVTGFEVLDRTRSGRATRIRLTGSQSRTVGAYEFRMATIRQIGGRVLKSTMFEVRREGSDYVFTGGGWGHGVGLSQYGAHGQAAEGRSYRQILDFYFQGTNLASYTSVGGPLVARSTATRELPSYTTLPTADDPLLDPSTPMDPAVREQMGIRTRPQTREERGLRTPPPPGAPDPALIDRIENRLEAGGWGSTAPATTTAQEAPTEATPTPRPAPTQDAPRRRRTAW